MTYNESDRNGQKIKTDAEKQLLWVISKRDVTVQFSFLMSNIGILTAVRNDFCTEKQIRK